MSKVINYNKKIRVIEFNTNNDEFSTKRNQINLEPNVINARKSVLNREVINRMRN